VKAVKRRFTDIHMAVPANLGGVHRADLQALMGKFVIIDCLTAVAVCTVDIRMNIFSKNLSVNPDALPCLYLRHGAPSARAGG
jgi:hypothetical protein